LFGISQPYFRRACREASTNLDIALAALKELRLNGLHVTTAMLNAIMSGAAERGDIDRTLSLLEEFQRNGVAPDADSYSFAMEALGKHLSRRTKTPAGQRVKDQCLDTASELLTRMEDEGVLPTHHIIRDYVELLCRAGQVGVATDIVLESMELQTTDNEDSPMPLVTDKTVYRVAMANAKQKNFEVARQVAACSSEPLPFLWRAIEAREMGAPFVDRYLEG
jgi:pentatricopeptide repeat protein